MRIGYSAWGFTGDYKIENGQHVSTPDGNATYSWSILYEAQRRGHRVFWMQKDRDAEAWRQFGASNFAAFSSKKRISAYRGTIQTGGVDLPELDVLLLEWRFPITGRNVGVPEEHPDFQPDLKRQTQLLEHYKGTRTKIIIWDLDHKLTSADELAWAPDAIFETSVVPRHQVLERTRVEPPVCVEDLLQFPTRPADPGKKLVYVGSRYERDEVITRYVGPTSKIWPGDVHFYGNWSKTIDECRRLWPGVQYHDRITVREFGEAYGDAVAVPLLAKPSYISRGFVTPRVWEALMFGSVPIGIEKSKGIKDYVLFSANDGYEMARCVEDLSGLTLNERDAMRRQNVEQISFMDVSHFMDRVEEVLTSTGEAHEER
jgi:hypothetical protein